MPQNSNLSKAWRETKSAANNSHSLECEVQPSRMSSEGQTTAASSCHSAEFVGYSVKPAQFRRDLLQQKQQAANDQFLRAANLAKHEMRPALICPNCIAFGQSNIRSKS